VAKRDQLASSGPTSSIATRISGCRGATPSTAAWRRVLNETLFRSLPHARAVLETWRHDYNPTSSHPSLYAIEEKGFC
jgi:transposase InsO family protein